MHLFGREFQSLPGACDFQNGLFTVLVLALIALGREGNGFGECPNNIAQPLGPPEGGIPVTIPIGIIVDADKRTL